MQFLNNTSIIRGKHTFRFGGEIRRDQFNQVGNQFARGQWTFDLQATQNPQTKAGGDSFAGFLLGRLYQAEAAVSIAEAEFRSNSFALYFDDTWKVSPSLTLSLGLRYERTPPWEDQTGKLFSVYLPYLDSTPNVADKSRYPKFIRQGIGTDPYAGVNLRWPNIDLLQDGRLGNRLVQVDNMDFAPRLGIAWTPNPKWVVRAGTGVFYNQDTGNPRFDMSRNLAGRVRFNPSDPEFPNLTWQNALASFTSAVAQVPTPYAFANKYERRTPYSIQYLLNVQRELGNDMVFEAGYLGSVSRHLEMLRAVNESLPGTVGSVNSRAPYPNFGRIQLVDNGGERQLQRPQRQDHEAIQQGCDSAGVVHLGTLAGRFERHSRAGRRHPVPGQQLLRAAASTDFRHSTPGSVLWPPDCGTCRWAKGKKVNISNRLADAAIGDWQIGSILTLQSGFPITPNIGGSDRSGTGGGFDRPNATGVSPYLDNPTTHEVVQSGGVYRAPGGDLRERGPQLPGGTGNHGVGFLPAQGFQDDGEAAPGIPLGAVQRRQPPGVGNAEHECQ